MSELKLNLGCGGNILEGWENRDADCDISKPLPWDDNTVDFILIEHCLEHVGSHDAFRFLEEAHRILKPGGVIRICVPDISQVMMIAISEGRAPNIEHMADLILGHGHLMVYSYDSLRAMLVSAGFRYAPIKMTDRRASDGHHKVIGIEKDDIETLRVEATK